MKKLLIALAIILVIAGCNKGIIVKPALAEIDLRIGGFLNVEDGEQYFITAKTIYPYKKFSLDWWITDIDRAINLQTEFITGLAINYNFGHLSEYLEFIKKIPVINFIDKYADFGVGYGGGVKDLFTRDCEFKQGITTFGFTFKF